MYALNGAAYYFYFMEPNVCCLYICACNRKGVLGMTPQLLMMLSQAV